MITWSHATNQNAASPFPQVYGCKNSRVFVYHKGPLTTKSHTLQSHSQMTPLVNKNVTSPFSPGLWSSNYPQWWLKVRGNQPQSLMTLCHVIMRGYGANEKRHFRFLEAYDHQTWERVTFDERLIFTKPHEP